MFPPPSLFSRPLSHFLSIFGRSRSIILLTPSSLPSSILSLTHTVSLAAPRTTPSGVSNLHESSAPLSSTRLPSYSTLPHSHFRQYLPHPSSSDHSLQPPTTSFYASSASAPTNTDRPLSGTSSSTSSMIVSALSFYDPAHASAVPDYQHLSRWDAPFAPTFPDTVDSRHSAFLPAGSASTSGDGFQSIQSATGFGFHRASVTSGGNRLHLEQPSQSQQHHRQIIPIPRRQRGPRHHDLTETQGQVQTYPLPSEQGQSQTEQREQRRAESQVRHLYRCPLHLFQC